MTTLSTYSSLFALLLVTACAADIGGSDSNGNGNGDNSGNGDGNGDGNGNGTNEACSLPALASAQQEGFFLAGDQPLVVADIYLEDDEGYESLVIEVANDAAGSRIGPGSYSLTLEESVGACNPCVALAKGSMEEVTLYTVATAGTLRVDTAEGKIGGRFSGAVTGLQLVEVDEEGTPASCKLTVPSITFDVTLEEG